MSYFEIDVMDGYRMYSTVVKAKSEKDGQKPSVSLRSNEYSIAVIGLFDLCIVLQTAMP